MVVIVVIIGCGCSGICSLEISCRESSRSGSSSRRLGSLLHLLRLPPGPILVVWMLLDVSCTKPLCLIYKGLFIYIWELLPAGSQAP